MTNYYNEYDLYAAQYLRNLIAAGHIAPGVVDTRSIEDVRPSDLAGFTQCHFFAGVGVWSLALRRAGWPDDRPVWTGSCPCQPFSAAGKGAGFADERHLWPAFYHLITQHNPPAILGEQVASSAVDAWIDLVHADLEALGYAFGSVPFPSAGVGAPHIRDRNYWVAHAQYGRREAGKSKRAWPGSALPPSIACKLGHASGQGLGQRECDTRVSGGAPRADARQAVVGADIHTGGLADTDGGHAGAKRQQRGGQQRQQPQDGGGAERLADTDGGADGGESEVVARSDVGRLAPSDGCRVTEHGGPGPTNGFWRAADWLGCRDGKWRPVEPGTFPLAHGAASRVGRLRAYGNAINAEAARVWIESVMESIQ